jgi:hypothetical protein
MATVPNHDSILQQIYLSQNRSTLVEVKAGQRGKYSSCLIGLIIGVLAGGIILAPITTIYISHHGQYAYCVFDQKES